MDKPETKKWIAGIAATVIAAVIIWLITSSDSCIRKNDTSEKKLWKRTGHKLTKTFLT